MIYLGADHGGYRLKEKLKRVLLLTRIAFVDSGSYQLLPNDDYPTVATRVARLVARRAQHRGVLLCRTGVGMAIAANKVARVRAVVGTNASAVIRSRREENTNVLALGAEFLTERQAITIIRAWLREPFRPLGRYRRRLRQLLRLDHGLR